MVIAVRDMTGWTENGNAQIALMHNLGVFVCLPTASPNPGVWLQPESREEASVRWQRTVFIRVPC